MRRADTADWIVLAGSLPPGAPREWYAELVTALRGAGARVAVDTSDAPLQALVDALPGSAPAPDEAQRRGARLLHRQRRRRRSSPTRRGRRAAAATLVDRGVELCWRPSARHGAVLVDRARAPGTPPRRRPPSSAPSVPATPACSATSSGTSRGRDPAQRLALAVAYGSAAAGLPGTTIPHPAQVRPELVQVTRLDLTPGG